MEYNHVLYALELMKAISWNSNSVYLFNGFYKKYRVMWDSSFGLLLREDEISRTKSMVNVKLVTDYFMFESTLQR